MSTDHVATDLPWVEKIAASFPVREFVAFHRDELPRLIERNGHLALADLRGVPPLAFCRIEDGTTFTWIASDGVVRIVDGDAGAATVVEITEQGFSDFINELITASGAISTSRARPVRGTKESWQRWEPAIRAITEGRPIYGRDIVEQLVDRRGTPFELAQSFSADTADDELREFLTT